MDKFNYLKEQLPAALATWQQTNGSKTTVGWMHAANPEVIAALLAELDAKDKRIAELEEEFAFIMGQNDGMEKELRDKDERIEHLEAKLATPVRLPDDLEPNTEQCVICGKVSSHPEGWHYCNRKNAEVDE